MEDKQIYEIIMKTQCEDYRQMLLLLNKICRVDEALKKLTLGNITLDTDKLQSLSNQKEYLIEQLNTLSLRIPKTTALLADTAFSLHEMTNSKEYCQMRLLERKCQEKLNYIINKEDYVNPAIVAQLKNYKSRLELDFKINQIPMEKRKIFFLKLGQSE